jgi:D-tyrosyl-tRNA(Tyr) deacylase
VRAVVSRVLEAKVTVDGEIVGEIDRPGLLVLLGITHSDNEEVARQIAGKLHELRILRDEESSATTGAPLLVVSQFTLYGDIRKGRRPSWIAAARPEQAEELVDTVVSDLRERGATVETGRFRAMMAVHSVNDGPFTVLLELPPITPATGAKNYLSGSSGFLR